MLKLSQINTLNWASQWQRSMWEYFSDYVSVLRCFFLFLLPFKMYVLKAFNNLFTVSGTSFVHIDPSLCQTAFSKDSPSIYLIPHILQVVLTLFQREAGSTFLLLEPGQKIVTASTSRVWATQTSCCLTSESRSKKEIRSSSAPLFFLEHLPLNSVIMLKGGPDHMKISHVKCFIEQPTSTSRLGKWAFWWVQHPVFKSSSLGQRHVGAQEIHPYLNFMFCLYFWFKESLYKINFCYIVPVTFGVICYLILVIRRSPLQFLWFYKTLKPHCHRVRSGYLNTRKATQNIPNQQGGLILWYWPS